MRLTLANLKLIGSARGPHLSNWSSHRIRAHLQYIAIPLFFFQAEDGIRDLTVTGVQTCALPISDVPLEERARQQGEDGEGEHRPEGGDGAAEGTAGLREQVPREQEPRPGEGDERSEERRVGKECRSRWSLQHQRTKSSTLHTIRL